MCPLIGVEFTIITHRFADWLFTAERPVLHCRCEFVGVAFIYGLSQGVFWGHPLGELCLTCEYA